MWSTLIELLFWPHSANLNSLNNSSLINAMIVGECLPASVDMLATGHYTKSSNLLHNCKIIHFDNTFIIAN